MNDWIDDDRLNKLSTQFSKIFHNFRDRLEDMVTSNTLMRSVVSEITNCRWTRNYDIVFDLYLKTRNRRFIDDLSRLFQRELGDMYAFLRLRDGGDIRRDNPSNIRETYKGMKLTVAFNPDEMAETRLTQHEKGFVDSLDSMSAKYSAPGHEFKSNANESVVRRLVEESVASAIRRLL